MRILILAGWLLALVWPARAQAVGADHLAYVTGGQLYAGYPHARLIAGPGNASAPAFSADGRWLAFLRDPGDSPSQLWLARADGSDARPVATASHFQWSPASDLLAIQPFATKGLAPIQLLTAGGQAHALPRHLSGSFLWLPDGTSLGVIEVRAETTRLTVVRGRVERSYVLPHVGRHARVRPVGWWPDGRHLLYQIDPARSASLAADGLPLFDLDLASGNTRRLGTILAYADWIAIRGNRLLLVTGAGRSAYFGKHLALCVGTARCHLLPPVSAQVVTLDPAWSPTGVLAYVAAPAVHTYGFHGRPYRRWLGRHQLWTARGDGSGAQRERAIPAGVEDPMWTRDGDGFLFVRDGQLWLDAHPGEGRPQRLARLIPDVGAPDHYGHTNWRALFAWY